MNNWQKTAEVLKNGGVVIIPSDSSYGIAALAANQKAVKRLYRIKAREPEKPSLLIVGSTDQARELVEFTPLAEDLAKKYWPGGLTLVLKAKNKDLPHQLYGTDHTTPHLRGEHALTLAVRLPDKKELQDLALKVGPFILPSANFTGEKPPFSPEELDKRLIDAVDFFLDEPTDDNPPSTLVDATGENPCILRQGSVKISSLSFRA